MTFSIQTSHPPLKTLGVTKIFLSGNILQYRDYFNQLKQEIFQSKQQNLSARLIDTTESSNSVPATSDRHAQLLTAGTSNNFKVGENSSARYAL